MIGVIDYGAGNLRSVMKALEYVGATARLVSTAKVCHGIDRLILPGVGAFGSAITALHASDLFGFIVKWLESGKPFLGICLGMQVLCAGSDEADGIQGLSKYPVRVQHFGSGKVPQIGWNQVKKVRSSRLLSGIPDNSFFYFLHGYYVPVIPEATTGTTDYGTLYSSVIEQQGMCAVQFHPEKSGAPGLAVLKNWVKTC